MTSDDEPPLFEVHVPIRKGRLGYLGDLVRLTGYSVWALAPIDLSWLPEDIRALPAPEIDHVWLLVDGRLVRAVIRLDDGKVLAPVSLDTAPIPR